LSYYPIFLGLGSNIGDREQFLKEAVQSLNNSDNFQVSNISCLYETEPKYLKDQARFYNLVLEGVSELTADDLLDFCKHIEARLGRDFQQKRNSPREIDIDILFFSDQVISSALLTIPHQKIEERRFVLQPITDIAPDYIHPVKNRTMQELLNNCSDTDQIEKIKDIKSWISH
jgi:2-amino-4-hydroxy-6-hydroxymethyldihydropteridine diphosphokinase